MALHTSIHTLKKSTWIPKKCICVITEAVLHLMKGNFLRNQNIIYFMSSRCPTLDSHWIQEFFKKYQIRVSNALSFHSWPVWFSNSCFVLVFWFCFSGELFKIDLRSRHTQKATLYTAVCTCVCSLVCQWSQTLTFPGWHHHPGWDWDTGAEVCSDDPEHWLQQ